MEKSPPIGSYLFKDDVILEEIYLFTRTIMKQSSYIIAAKKLKDMHNFNDNEAITPKDTNHQVLYCVLMKLLTEFQIQWHIQAILETSMSAQTLAPKKDFSCFLFSVVFQQKIC